MRHCKIVVSACLAGVACRHDGQSRPDPRIMAMVQQGEAIAVCPEELAGLGTPRQTAAFISDDLQSVATGEGRDVTPLFEQGAQEVLRIASAVGATQAILKERSPSCGVRSVYRRRSDGTEEVVRGQGITARRLREAGLSVISDEELE